MRSGLVILIGLLLIHGPLFASEEVIVGAVVSVDRQTGELVVKPIMGADPKSIDEDGAIRLQAPSDQLGPYLQEGTRIRIWRDRARGAESNMVISPLRGGPAPAGGEQSAKPPPPNDPTGVRFRILRGMGRPGAPPSPRPTPGGPGGPGGGGRR